MKPYVGQYTGLNFRLWNFKTKGSNFELQSRHRRTKPVKVRPALSRPRTVFLNHSWQNQTFKHGHCCPPTFASKYDLQPMTLHHQNDAAWHKLTNSLNLISLLRLKLVFVLRFFIINITMNPFVVPTLIFSRVINVTMKRLHICWWRMLETKCVADNFELMVTVLAILVINILHLAT